MHPLKHLCTLLLIVMASNFYSLHAQEYLEILLNETLTYDEIVRRVEAHFDDKGRGKHTGYKLFLRWKYFAKRNLDSSGRVIGNIRSAAVYQEFLNSNPTHGRSAAPWIEKGPLSAVNTATWSSHIGRITNIAIDDNNHQHIIITSPGGGVWKTTNEGATWAPIFDDMSSLNAYSALISHGNSNHYLVGTSGLGLLRSTNGGLSWVTANGISTSVLIYSIIQHPTDAQIFLACGDNGRVYRSTDGGANWTSISLQGSALYDIEFKPNNPNVVYASGRSGGLYKSINNGVSFTPLSGPWASNHSLMMAVTPHDSEYLYVLEEKSGGFGGLHRSTNSGTSFTTRSNDNAGNNNIMGYSKNENGGQAPRDMDVIVSPTNKNEVHVAGIMTFKSTNGGSTWTQTTHWIISDPLPFVHADIDQLVYKGSKIYVASDGGIFISSNGGSSFADKTTGLGLRQFYRISASPIEVGRVAGGSQDNGTGVLHANGIWYDWVGADGMEPAILNEDEDIIIGSIQYGGLYKSTDGGDSRTGINNTQSGENGAWVTPLEKDPFMRNTIYQAKRHVYKSSDGGSGWQTISNISPARASDNKIQELCIAPSDNQYIYVAYEDQLFGTTNGGAAWTDITPSIGGISYYNYINVHPSNAQHVIIAVSGGSRFLESTDGGSSWTNITYNLPTLGANSVVMDGTASNGIYVSLTKGVYYKDNATPTSWTLVGTGLPNVNITELEIIGNKLYAATYGRGLWETDIPALGCALRANVLMEACNSQSTVDPIDDTFTFSVDPTGSGLSTTYSISGDVTINNIAYGTKYIVDNGGAPFNSNNGAVNITLTDDGASTCPTTINVSPPASCFTNLVCADALVLPGPGIYHASGPNAGDGATHSNADHANWFSFTPVVDGDLTVHSCLMGVDTRVYIYTGTCGNLTEVGSSDDACEMTPGGDTWASRIEDLAVTAGTEYLIEWDDRWSSSAFDFVIEFDSPYNIDECVDYLYGDITNMVVNDELRAKQEINIHGTGTGPINTYTNGIVKFDQSFQLAPGAELILNTDSCYVNDTLDWMVLGGAAVPILDNTTIDIALEVPANINYLITDIDVTIKLDHTYLGDLSIDLISPDNTSIRLWDHFCGTENDLDFILDEDAISQTLCGSTWRSGNKIYASGSIPASTLNVFDGTSSAGIWKIRINDNANNDQGTVELVSVRFKGE